MTLLEANPSLKGYNVILMVSMFKSISQIIRGLKF
jgi:hypothetical protein